jgi:hypothetical protein
MALTPEQRPLLIWAGAALVVLIVAGIWLGSGATTLEQTTAEADKLHASYKTLYPVDGVAKDEAVTRVGRVRDDQHKALDDAEARLVPDLPNDYQVGDLAAATARVNVDYETLRKRAQREKFQLAEQLPLRDGLDADADKRALQLAQLYLVRNVVELCMNSGVGAITAIEAGKPYQDASGTYAVIPATFHCKGAYDSTQKLLEALRTWHDRGIGLSALDVEHGDDGTQTVSLAVDLITLNRGWKLGAEGARPAATPTRPRTRLRSGG